MQKKLWQGSALLAAGGVGVASAAADPVITSAITTMTTAFTDNFTVVAGMFVGFVVVVAMVSMLVRYFKRAK